MAAVIDDYRALLEEAGTLDLREWCVLRLSGSDAGNFLQGMATQDLATTGGGPIRRTLFLTEKGRPVAHAWVRIDPSGASALVIADAGAKAALRPHFERFRIMEDVEFEGPEPAPLLLGVAGPRRGRCLEELAATIPVSEAIPADPLSFVLGGAGAGGGSPAETVSDEAAEAWRLRVGLPRSGLDFDLDRIATEVALPEIISSEKGCYVGQEVVARTSNRGQVRRRRVGFRFPWTDGALAAKAELRSGGTPSGYVTSSAREPGTDEGLGMGYLTVEAIQSGEELLAVGNTKIVPVRLRDWPL